MKGRRSPSAADPATDPAQPTSIDSASLRSVHPNRVPNKGRRVWHGQSIEFREVRVDDVIVAMSKIPAR